MLKVNSEFSEGNNTIKRFQELILFYMNNGKLSISCSEMKKKSKKITANKKAENSRKKKICRILTDGQSCSLVGRKLLAHLKVFPDKSATTTGPATSPAALPAEIVHMLDHQKP